MTRTPPPMRFPTYTVPELDRYSGLGRFNTERYPRQKRGGIIPRYRLDLCRDGALTIAEHRQKPFNGVAIGVMFDTDLDRLKLIQATVCKLQYEDEPKTADRIDAGRRYVFSWGIRTGTIEQLERIGDVCWLVGQERIAEAVDLAWEYDRLAAAEDPGSGGFVYPDLEAVTS